MAIKQSIVNLCEYTHSATVHTAEWSAQISMATPATFSMQAKMKTWQWEWPGNKASFSV